MTWHSSSKSLRLQEAAVTISVIAVLGLTSGCGFGAQPPARVASSGQATTRLTPTATALTCGEIRSDLSIVVSDLKRQDEHYQEAWVSGGNSSDLQALINDTQNAATRVNQLNGDAITFNQDATAYLADNSPDLAPDWQSDYSTVTDDINALANDCGQQKAPPNTPANS